LKPRSVIFAPEARDDLLALYDWIAGAASPKVALSYIERLEAFCLGFSHVSERGTRRDDIRPGLRIAGFERRVTIAFAVDKEHVTILRLFYGGRNWEEITWNEPLSSSTEPMTSATSTVGKRMERWSDSRISCKVSRRLPSRLLPLQF
jgi:toxin ParE1/3/4